MNAETLDKYVNNIKSFTKVIFKLKLNFFLKEKVIFLKLKFWLFM